VIRRSHISGALFIVMMACVVVLIARRPFDGDSLLSWTLLAVALGAFFAVGWLNKAALSPEHDAFLAWQTRLVALKTRFDVEDVFIHERLNSAQWEEVYLELESRPKDQRSLKDALRVRFPKLET
jgi:hypothetical protein